jgi:hypothetical protein
MSKEFIRFWHEEDIDTMGKHLIIVGESFSSCGNCQEMGLDFAKHSSCPHCHIPFKYITARHAGLGASDRFRQLRKIREKRPDLPLIDFDDFDKARKRNQARDLFK